MKYKLKSFLYLSFCYSMDWLYQGNKNILGKYCKRLLLQILRAFDLSIRIRAYPAGKQLYLMTHDTVTRFIPQPPCVIEKMFAVSSKCIYVSDNSPYQNSNLYQWNGKFWQKLDFKVANNISDMHFVDADTGALVSYGEVVRVDANIPKHITPPTNRYI